MLETKYVLNFKYSYGGNVFEFVSKKFDPFSDENCLIYYKIWDVLCEMMENTLFPIKLFFEDKEINTFDAQQFEELEDGSLDNRYQYKLNPENYSMEIWDNKTCTRINICLKDQYERYSTKYFFKGMEVKEDHFILDVRKESEIKNDSKNKNGMIIPMEEITERYIELKDKKNIITLCPSGIRSNIVSSFLKSKGIESRVLIGGIKTLN